MYPPKAGDLPMRTRELATQGVALRGSVGDRLDDEHVSGSVYPVGNRPVDNAPEAHTARQAQDLAETRFPNGVLRPVAAEDLWRVQLAGSAFPYAPHNSAHD